MKKYVHCSFIVFVIACQFGIAQEYVVTKTKHVNIRTNPSTGSFVVGQSMKGDIYEMIGEEGEWFVIKLFSENPRYINKCCALKLDDPITDRLGLPESSEQCESIYSSIQALKYRARREATELIPQNVDEELNMNMQQILEDMHILNLFEIYSLNPAVYPILIEKSVQNNW
ncbi:hypothetical protein KKC74_08450 [bacterium]|nr:hypothetical protein [bacterium]